MKGISVIQIAFVKRPLSTSLSVSGPVPQKRPRLTELFQRRQKYSVQQLTEPVITGQPLSEVSRVPRDFVLVCSHGE